MRMSHIMVAYFVIGAVMWGGGAIQWQDAGIGQYVIEQPGANTQINETTGQNVEKLGGPIQQAAGSFTGGLLAVWNILVTIIGYMFWPVQVLVTVNAPPRAQVLLGGTLVMAFIGALVRLVSQSG